MAYRYTFTDKWNDAWFSNLKPIEKLLFMYLCDNCNCAGFIEIILKKWIVDIGTDMRGLEGALKGLEKALIYSNDKSVIYIKTFLKHQKNLPLNEKNNAHKGILEKFDSVSHKFDIVDITDFIQRGLTGANEGLNSPYGNGKGNGKDKEGGMGEEKKTWRNDFETYLKICNEGYKNYNLDLTLIEDQKRMNPGVDVLLSIEKGYKNFWGTVAGWKHKKKSRSSEIDWKSTITNSIGINKVWKQKQ